METESENRKYEASAVAVCCGVAGVVMVLVMVLLIDNGRMQYATTMW